jgi:hypothetical protein
MSTSLIPTSLLESIGIQAVQKAIAATPLAGKLTLGDDGSGIDAVLEFSSDQSLNINDLSFTGGLNGRIYIEGLDTDPLKATLFSGFDIALTAFDLTFAQSGLAASNIGGSLTIPFFTNSSGQPNTVDIEISTKSDGTINISVAAQQSTQSTTPDGLIQLFCPLPGSVGTVELDVASLEIDKAADGTWTILFSGNLIIDVAGLNFPTIALQGLGISSDGHVSLQGGWIDLPSQLALDFFGFHVGLQKLGFGTAANGDRWIGFNGDISLVEGISLGGSVRGLQINLSTGDVSLDGVSISFEIPDVLSINGEIDHVHVDATSAADFTNAGLNGTLYSVLAPHGGSVTVDLFAGQVSLVIEAAGDLEVDATFITGTFQGHSVFFLDLDVELPVGIPLFLDVSLWGIQGLVATSLEPEPEPAQTWWQWYKYTDATDTTTDYSATNVNKWISAYKPGAFAIGGGVTIGTEFDDGFTVSAAIMLVVMMPGPVISLIGKANILSKRIGGADEDANFEAMATYDGNSDTFDLVIQAQYSIPIVLDISATAELYVGGGDWFFAMGKPPREKRVSARIFDLFETDAYFIISNQGLVTGTWTGYQNSWSFGPLSASLDAYLATLAAIQWSPFQLGGGIELYGNVHLSAFGIGIGITADALLEGSAPNPFYIHGELSLELDLPWPLPNIGASVSLSWGGDDGSVPPPPLALGHIDATLIDHCDSNAKPASDHYTLLAHRSQPVQPDLVNGVPLVYDVSGKPGILNLQGPSLAAWTVRSSAPGTFAGFTPDNTSSVQMAPVVPQDAHLTLNFSHPTQDSTNFFAGAMKYGVSPFPAEVVAPALPNNTLIGPDDMSDINPDPPTVDFTIRHSLTEVALYQWSNNAWSLLYTTANPVPATAGGPTVFTGVWLRGDASKTDPNSVMTQLKIIPYSLVTLPNGQATAKLGILPSAPSLYALRAVTQVEAARVGSGSYQTVTDGYPIVEYTYLQTASGPGTAIGVPAPQPTPIPNGPAPFLQLAKNCSVQQQPPSSFPIAGSLHDLNTYTQWSWPLDGAVSAYFGYDVSVEFVETYVNQLYNQFAGDGQSSLHFRCVDRNNRYTAIVPNAEHVPSVPSNSALVATEVVPALPATLAPPSNIILNPIRFPIINPHLFDIVTTPAATTTPQPAPATPAPATTKPIAIAAAKPLAQLVAPLKSIIAPAITAPTNPIIDPKIPITGPAIPITPVGPILHPTGPIDPGGGVIGTILHEQQEAAAAAQARSIWFRPFYPSTLYTLDIVAGPLFRLSDVRKSLVPTLTGSAEAIFSAKDALAALAALQAFYAYEDSLTSLQRFTFTTSRFATFTAQMQNVTTQLAASAGATPIRNYTAPVDPITWLESNTSITTSLQTALPTYNTDRATLNATASNLDALADALQLPALPNNPPPAPPIGNAELVQQRQTVASAWSSVSQAFTTVFDGLITALGHPEYTTGKPPITVPDTELSLFLNSDNFVVALMLESPEPLPWQRIWRYFTLGTVGVDLQNLVPLWSADRTRALLIPSTQVRGGFPFGARFVGDIGAEAPCIMLNGLPVVEPVSIGTVTMGPAIFNRPNWPPIIQHPIFDKVTTLLKVD